MVKLIDTHAHYDDEAFEADRDQLLQGLFSETVKKIVTIGCAYDRWEPTIRLVEKYPNMYFALGLHPEDIYNLPGDWEDRLTKLLQHPKAVALGEIGLDYHYENYDRDLQIGFFKEQIRLAKNFSLPIIIHSRDATEDTMNVLKELKPQRAVMHCFSGSAETAAQIVKMGLYVSFTGVLTFKNAKRAVEACRAVPMDRLMLETDCPYMAPVPYRGERCHSGMILSTAEKMGEIKGVSRDEMIEICNRNSERFFGF